MELPTNINWERLKVVVFDVDGTLYTQSMLRRKMLADLLLYYLFRPWRIKELRMLQDFRAEREKKAGYSCDDLENAQYHWCALKGGWDVATLKKVVAYWMFNYPNKYLAACVHPHTHELFALLKEKGFKIAIYSDYAAHDKLKAMNLEADLIVSSTDSHISCLKPDPKALLYISKTMKVLPEECLFIGDRQELDGQCAENAGMPYLIIEKKPISKFDFFKTLVAQLSLINTLKAYETNFHSSN